VTPLTLIPDIEKIVTDYLRAHADIVALNTRIRVTPPDDKSTSWVKVTKLSAPSVNSPDHLIEYMTQFDCFAGESGGVPEVNTLSRTVRAVVKSMEGVTGAATITGVHFQDGPRNVDPDLEKARDRVTMTAFIWAHA
jgi:hypothetical protein